MLALLFYLAVVIGSALLAYLLGLVNGALYIPTDRGLVEQMLDAAMLTEGDRLVDLGSGDGRLVIAAALRGAQGVGYEINPLLVWLARRNAKRAGVASYASFHWKDFWSADLSPYSVVTVFGIGHIMRRLERKLEAELAPGSRVVSNLFAFPTWNGEKRNGCFLYIRQFIES